MLNEDGDFTTQEYKTVTFNKIIDKRKERVLTKEKKANAKTKTKSKNTENVDDIQAAGRKVRFDLEQTKVKVPANDGIDELEVHNNAAFEDSDNETDSLKAIPILKSSYDISETEKTDAVDVSKSTGSFFSSQTSHVSPRLKRKASLAETVHENDNVDTATTNIKSFRESDISENDGQSEEEEEEAENANFPSDSFTGEMKRINKTLPNSEALNKKYKAKDVEEIKQQNKIDQKKFSEGKSKDKTKIKHVLKDLMKTTKSESAKLPLTEEAESVGAQRKPSHKELESNKIYAKTNNIETVEYSSDNNGNSEVGIHESIEANLKSINEPKIDDASSERKVHRTTESESNSINTHSKNSVKSRPGKKEDPILKPFKLEESSSDGDDVEMIYQSDKVVQKRKELYQLNTDTDDEKEENEITVLKPILKAPKGKVPKSGSPEMIRKFCKDVSKADTKVRTSKEFKMPDDLVLEDNEDDVWRSLRSSQIIPVTVTDSMRSMESVYKTRGSVEKDKQILDWEADLNEGSKVKTSFNTNSNSTHSKTIGENLAIQKKKRGVNRLDSSRKYLGAAVLIKTKKITK